MERRAMQGTESKRRLGWPPEAIEFMQLYARIEGELKRVGNTKRGRKLAEADWGPLAESLGEEFFHFVRDSKLADTLVGEPPRRLMNQGLEWQPAFSPPIENVLDLFTRGICQVRHNLAHGEKFDVTGSGWDRDIALVTQALWTLERALERSPLSKSTPP